MKLTKKQKAAILLVSLPPETAQQVFKEFKKEEVQELSNEIAKLPSIPAEVKDAVLNEFYSMSSDGPMAKPKEEPQDAFGAPSGPATAFINRPKVSFTQEIGTHSMSMPGRPPVMTTPLGAKKGMTTTMSSPRTFDFLLNIDEYMLVNLLRREHPQTIALILSNIQSTHASSILSLLPQDLQTEVARRLVEIRKVPKEILDVLQKILEKLISNIDQEPIYTESNRGALVEILSQADKKTEEKIIKSLSQKDPTVVSRIKNQLCDFADLNTLDEASLKQVLRLTDMRDLTLALKGASPEISNRVFGVMSPDSAKALREDIESIGRVDWEEIKAAQQQIRNILRGLVTLGKVQIK